MPRETFPSASRPSEQNKTTGRENPSITPEEVFRIERSGYSAGRKTPYAFRIVILLFIFALLLSGGLLLMYHLSKHPLPVADTPGSPSRPVPAPPPPPTEKRAEEQPGPVDSTADPAVDKGVTEREKDDADRAMADLVGAREDLDERGGAKWGGLPYREMAETVRQADALYLKKDYGPASVRYKQALAMVTALKEEAPKALLRLLDEGNQALEAGEGNRARDRFTLALLIDPSNRIAQGGLARAEKAEAVARLLASGKRHEDRNKPAFALADYDQARRLDPESRRAQEAFQRVRDIIAEDAFRRHMSTGLAALNRGDFEGARAALESARGLRPNSREVRDALDQVDQAARLAEMERHQREALEAEQSEDWERALAAYQAVLELDPRVQFAIQGKERSLEMIQLRRRVAYYLGKPEVLESEQYLEKAIQLLSEADGNGTVGPRLKSEVEKLRLLVREAQIPLEITLESDNLTQVAVYRVGRLGTFFKKDLSLRPGTYTMVGTRSGYKDVRRKVVIKPGQPLRITIICKEKI